MSFDALCWVRNLSIGGLDRLVMYELAQFTGEDDSCFPSLSTLADACGIARSTLIKTLKKLESAGHIKRVSRSRPDGSASSNVYELQIGAVIKRVVRQTDHPQSDSRTTVVRQTDPINQSQESVKKEDVVETTPPPASLNLVPAIEGVTSTEKRSAAARFQSFWDVWPKHKRKVDRGGCERVWISKKLDDQADAILSAVALLKQSKDWTKDGGEFIPLPITFLRQERWSTFADDSADDFWARETA